MTNSHEFLHRVLGRTGPNPSEEEFAQGIADDICAQERLQKAAREQGDLEDLEAATKQRVGLTRLAKEWLDPDKHPGMK